MYLLDAIWHSRQVEAIGRFVTDDGGQDVIEYAFLAAFVGIAGALVLQALSGAIFDTYSSWIDPTVGAPSLWEPPEPPAAGS